MKNSPKKPGAGEQGKGDRFIFPLEIEAEQALVAANRELIARFEKKIQATLTRVWGEDRN